MRYNCVWGCGRHTDLNKDGFCDYSFVTQPEKKETEESSKKDSVVAVADTVGKTTPPVIETSQNPTGAMTKQEADNSKLPAVKNQAPTGNEGIPTDAQQVDEQDAKADGVVVIPPAASEFVPAHDDPVYDLILVTVVTLLLYFTTLLLYRENIIKRVHHRKIWNLLLLLTFLVSCLFGLFLVIQINYHVAMSAYGTLLYWHVEIGIAMTLIAVIHILWHFTYFKNMLKKW
ncbi:MAG: hypothetical protein R6V49_02640 [Bacteroidales bacterium]